MAQLSKSSYPWPEWIEGTSFDAHFKVERERLDALEAAATASKTLLHQLVRFPQADGYALYRVVKEQPLTLQHIPFGDAWQVPYAMIRGLRRVDVARMVENAKAIRKLFSKDSGNL